MHHNLLFVSLQKQSDKIPTMELPQDPNMLFSFINMKLRDFYPSLTELCNDLDIDQQVIEKILNEAGYEYNEELNKFW